jgi:hypothetical protein
LGWPELQAACSAIELMFAYIRLYPFLIRLPIAKAMAKKTDALIKASFLG